MKSYTDLEQSRKLADILPIESADMYYFDNLPVPKVGYSVEVEKLYSKANIDYIPCWSLAALLELIPNYVINKVDDKIYANLYYGLKSSHDNLVDAAFEMIKELHELKML